MRDKPRWLPSACGCFVLTLHLAGSAFAQVSEVDYKTLYAAAEYDKALELVTSLEGVEAQQYKALCLLALGRQADASTAIEALVNSSPTFIPSADDAPPRFVELVTKVRQKLLPTIARRVFAEGRERYADKQNDEAVKRFSLVLTLLNDPAFADANTKQDLETLAKGFIDLASATPPPVKVTAAPPEPIPPPPPAPSGVAAPPPKIIAPVALVQTVPPMPAELAARTDAKLVIVVLIDETGRVTGATVKESAHPVYDRLVTQATRNWRYAPATRNDVPIPSEQVVTIQVKR
jgi:TonB family protein